MPTLDWLNREDAFRIAARVPTRVLRPHEGEVGKLWAERSGGGCLFAMVFKERGGLDMAQQIDAVVAGAT